MIKQYLKRALSSWPTFTGSLIALAEAVYGMLRIAGVIQLPQETFTIIMEIFGVVMANLYILFTIGNNPADKSGY